MLVRCGWLWQCYPTSPTLSSSPLASQPIPTRSSEPFSVKNAKKGTEWIWNDWNKNEH